MHTGTRLKFLERKNVVEQIGKSDKGDLDTVGLTKRRKCTRHK